MEKNRISFIIVKKNISWDIIYFCIISFSLFRGVVLLYCDMADVVLALTSANVRMLGCETDVVSFENWSAFQTRCRFDIDSIGSSCDPSRKLHGPKHGFTHTAYNTLLWWKSIHG